MSDQPQAPGWWMASDGKFYPPQSAPERSKPKPSLRKPFGLMLVAPFGAVVALFLLLRFVPAVRQDVDVGSSVFWTLVLIAVVGFTAGLIWLIVNLFRG